MQVSSRAHFTAADLRFVVDTLAHSAKEGDALLQLLPEAGMLDRFLDEPRLHEVLVERPACIAVSPDFYFYVLVRRALLRHGLDDRRLCDYLARMLAAFTHQRHLQPAAGKEAGRSFGYLGDMLAAADQAPAAQTFGLRHYLADYALFLCGIFKERVEARRHGAPGVGFYEAVGQSSYRSAAACPEAQRHNVRDLFERLAEAFREVRVSLNDVADRTLHWEAG
ncbi:MAG: hypothetical protein PW734_03035 [Verrucomicrobium sp.]|nr:hypothetical protein [Verrucomicrobium sp.]